MHEACLKCHFRILSALMSVVVVAIGVDDVNIGIGRAGLFRARQVVSNVVHLRNVYPVLRNEEFFRSTSTRHIFVSPDGVRTNE